MLVDLASREPPAALPDGHAGAHELALEIAVEHRPAGEHDGRDVHCRGGHDPRRRGLVAARGQHDGVYGVAVEYLHQPEVGQVTVERRGRAAAVLEDRVYRELHRDAARVADAVAHPPGELEVDPVAGRQVAAGLGYADYGPARAQLLGRDPVVHEALEVERRLVHTLRVVEPVTRAEPARGPAVISRHDVSLPTLRPAALAVSRSRSCREPVSPSAGWSARGRRPSRAALRGRSRPAPRPPV